MYPLPLWFWLVAIPCLVLCFILEDWALRRRESENSERNPEP